METNLRPITEQLAELAYNRHTLRTGHAPKSVAVVLSKGTLVFTLHGALSPAEQDLASSPKGASQVQEFHRQLFTNSSDEMRQEIERLTGQKIRQASVEVETASGTLVQAFSSGDVVQIFLLTNGVAKSRADESRALNRAENEGLYPISQTDKVRLSDNPIGS